MKKCYQRMYRYLKGKLSKDQVISRRILQSLLYQQGCIRYFEKIYQTDCGCSGYWSFFDFSDRFARFANEMVKCRYFKKLAYGKYQVLY